MANYKDVVSELLKGIKYIVDEAQSKTTKIYNGVIKSSVDNEKWKVQFNGQIHEIPLYGNIVPQPGKIVKVVIPDNNLSLAFFI